MLILTRRIGEEIVMTLTQDMPAGSRFTIALLNTHGNQSRIGIDAPRSVTVDRAEIDERKQKEQGSGAVAVPP